MAANFEQEADRSIARWINACSSGHRAAAQARVATVIGNHISIASNTTIMPVSICDDSMIVAGAVTQSITVPGVYAGNPADWIRDLPTGPRR